MHKRIEKKATKLHWYELHCRIEIKMRIPMKSLQQRVIIYQYLNIFLISKNSQLPIFKKNRDRIRNYKNNTHTINTTFAVHQTNTD